jgi:fumarate reductase flavoprotein subunit
MKKHRILTVISALLMTVFFAAACGNVPASRDSSGSGTGVAIAPGFGGDVTVTIRVSQGRITEVKAEGPGETPGIGGDALEKLPPAMVAANDVRVDALSGATATSRAILSAASRAYALASGGKLNLAAVKMTPGVYRNSVWAFSVDTRMDVAVTVDETKILDINIEKNGETLPILQNAKDLLIPRILANQSIAVDAITGASGSSAGIRSGVILALEQALAAGGSDPSAIENFMTAPAKAGGAARVLDYDVLVIGMGGSGSAAAMSAVETQKAEGKPVSVLAIDKAGKYGGTSSVTSEMMAINPPRFMAAHANEVAKIQLGVFARPLPDTRRDKSVYVEREVLKRDWLAYTEGAAKENMLDIMLDNSGPTLDWLVYDHGFFFGLPQLGVEPSATYYVVFQYNGSFMDNKHLIIAYFDKLYDDYLKLGGRYMLETEAYELVYDRSGSRVTGAKARGADGTEYLINAKSVVLATGGFAGNGDMTSRLLSEQYYPLKGVWNQVGMTQNDGKMIQSALDIGAGTYNIGMTPIVHIGGGRRLIHDFENTTVEVNGRELPYSLNDVPMVLAISPDVMSVNKLGERFTDESGLGFLEPWKGGPEFYSIWSRNRIDKAKIRGFDFVSVGAFISQGGVPPNYPILNIDEVIESAKRHGVCYEADTLEDLAKQLGIDPAKLSATVQRYNGYCRTGTDTDFHKDARFLAPIDDTGPYYAFLGAPYCYSTTGGLDVDTSFRVLREDHATAIPGLYAAGTDCLGVLLTEKKAYVTYGGLAQGWAFTSGKLAGASAARAD